VQGIVNDQFSIDERADHPNRITRDVEPQTDPVAPTYGFRPRPTIS
jgi:hypothetical protein